MTSVNKNLPTASFLEKFSKFIMPPKRKMFLKKSLRISIIIIDEMIERTPSNTENDILKSS